MTLRGGGSQGSSEERELEKRVQEEVEHGDCGFEDI